MHLHDAHNHLMDARFSGATERLVSEAREAGVHRMVVNSTRESDWPEVSRLAATLPGILPSYGIHPWYLASASDHWKEALRARLVAEPDAAVGEIGIDRWILEARAEVRDQHSPGLASSIPASLEQQAAAFVWQLGLAAELGRPASLHCLQAWGFLLELLRASPRPKAGFLLHSYGGPREMIPALAELGAFFGFPGYFLHERKERQREVFRHVPIDRLLVETDAPDQPLPEASLTHPFHGTDGHSWNHPANLRAVYQGLAPIREVSVESLAASVEANFHRLFGRRSMTNGQ